jgi:TRAP-type C4-dicarboxylate transport system permease small subunit
MVEKALMGVAGTMLVVMLATTTIDAVGRYVFNTPLAGNYEFISFFAMVMLAFLALPRTYTLGGQIRITAFESVLSRFPMRLPGRINALLGALAFGAITLYAGAEALEKIVHRETTLGIVQIPVYISFVSFPLGCGVLTLRLLIEIFFPALHESPKEEFEEEALH